MPNEPIVCLLSGGLDSSVALALMLSKGHQVHALSVDYGARHWIELEAAKAQVRHHQVKGRRVHHTVLSCDMSPIGGSALTDHTIPVPTGEAADRTDDIPVTYVPARNAVLLSLAAGLAETIGARGIVIGVNAVDYAGYPDCRPEFISAMEMALHFGTRAGANGDTITIYTPLMRMSKADIVTAGFALDVPFARTISCYDPDVRRPDGHACRVCSACRIRAAGFACAGRTDPGVVG